MERRRGSTQPPKEESRKRRDSLKQERGKCVDSLAGKKRKKKKRPEPKEKVCDRPGDKKFTPFVLLQTYSAGASGPSSTGSSYCSSECSDNSLPLLQQDSSSSTENSKPATKVTRINSPLSSEALTTRRTSSHGETDKLPLLPNTTTPKPLSTSSHSHSKTASDTANAVLAVSSVRSTHTSSSHSTQAPLTRDRGQPESMTNSNSSSTTATVTTTGGSRVASNAESLRWDHERSDEEKEKDRIDTYKTNRRRRYNKLLQTIKHSTHHHNPYYASTESS